MITVIAFTIIMQVSNRLLIILQFNYKSMKARQLLVGVVLVHQWIFKIWVCLFIGTGSNAAYVEKIKNVDKWTGPMEDPEAEVG